MSSDKSFRSKFSSDLLEQRGDERPKAPGVAEAVRQSLEDPLSDVGRGGAADADPVLRSANSCAAGRAWRMHRALFSR